MYTVLIVLHSWLRWVVLLAGLMAVARAAAGRSSGRAWGPRDAGGGRLYTVLFDVQFLIGLLLYLFASPIIAMARQYVGESMADPATRYWFVEHPAGMIVALALAHVGRVRVRKATTDRSRFSRALVFYGLSVLIMVVTTPWPGTPYGRELFRFG
ncbi:MAG TPA: hypothetical protein VK886_14790 [Vicinamibacterales bacterium]|nr:hypothetical protein [Vicinamibacterales bacterium]